LSVEQHEYNTSWLMLPSPWLTEGAATNGGYLRAGVYCNCNQPLLNSNSIGAALYGMGQDQYYLSLATGTAWL
jgi:hypothetical protein